MKFYVVILALITLWPSISSPNEVNTKAVKDALIIQFGVDKTINLVEQYADKKAKYYLKKYDVEFEVAATLFIWNTYKLKRFSFPIDNTQLTIGFNYITIDIRL